MKALSVTNVSSGQTAPERLSDFQRNGWEITKGDGYQWLHPANGAVETAIQPYELALAFAGGGVASRAISSELKTGESLFLSERFGITSTTFGSSAAGGGGSLNRAGGIFKAGWSNLEKDGVGGWQFRVGIGRSSGSSRASFHMEIPGTFVRNEFAVPAIQVKQSLLRIAHKPLE
jgi:hypothetical protein